MKEEAVFDFSIYTNETLQKISKFLKRFLVLLELKEKDESTDSYTLPLKSFEDDGFSYSDIKAFHTAINKIYGGSVLHLVEEKELYGMPLFMKFRPRENELRQSMNHIRLNIPITLYWRYEEADLPKLRKLNNELEEFLMPIEVNKLQAALEILDVEERREVERCAEEIKGRGITVEGARTAYFNPIHKKYELKRLELSELLLKVKSRLIAPIQPANSLSPCWITKDSEGNYFYEAKKVFVKSKSAKYMKIFDSVFSLIPQGGEISYDAILTECKSRRLTAVQKSILRALTIKDASFFKYVKDVPFQPLYGIPLFVANQNGKVLTFNNKK